MKALLPLYTLCSFGAATNLGLSAYHSSGNLWDGFGAAVQVLCIAAVALLIVTKP